MGTPIFQVDAFTDQPFRGNPAAVCLLAAPADAEWMQQVAAEMNLAETAFLHPVADGFQLRWFTPAIEVDLCGHATLASAHVLWESGRLAEETEARFHTRSGLLTATRSGDWIELNFPATPPAPTALPAGLLDALGLDDTRYTGKTLFDYFIEVADEATVRTLSPDFTVLGRFPIRGIIVTSRASTDGFDFVSRFFAPAAGIPEDPVTGSAHCGLTPYWRAQLGKEALVALQASARGGVLHVRQSGDRIYLRGQAVTVLYGDLLG
jgi:PhzF family phenazine biosynthesis protein